MANFYLSDLLNRCNYNLNRTLLIRHSLKHERFINAYRAKVKGPLGDIMYRFKGMFQRNKENHLRIVLDMEMVIGHLKNVT